MEIMRKPKRHRVLVRKNLRLPVEEESEPYDLGNRHMLVNEPGYVIDTTLIKKIGLNQAVLLTILHYSLCEVAENNEDKHIYEGRWWVRSTYEQWHEKMHWRSVVTIKRIFKQLRDTGIILKRTAAKSFDHTLWYTIDYDRLDEYLVDKAGDTTLNREDTEDVEASVVVNTKISEGANNE